MSLEKTDAIYMVLHRAMEVYLEEGKKADDLIKGEMHRGISVNNYTNEYARITNNAIKNFIERLEELIASDAYEEIKKEIWKEEYITEG